MVSQADDASRGFRVADGASQALEPEADEIVARPSARLRVFTRSQAAALARLSIVSLSSLYRLSIVAIAKLWCDAMRS
jgi:hypothetical protein